MDIATIFGFLVTFGLFLGSMLMGGSLTTFVNFPGLMVVVGGTFGVAFVNYPMKRIFSAFAVVKNVFSYDLPDLREQNEMLVDLAGVVRKEGILALESKLSEFDDPFMKRGMQLLVDGVDVEKVEDLMYEEIDRMETRHKQGAEIFESLAATSPSLGLIGTLIGLVKMLKNMDDPSSIGPAMAIALLTTFYGAIMGYVIFQPIAGKLQIRHQQEILGKEIMVQGLLGIGRGENPRILGQKLEVSLPPKLRDEEALE
jgi:chemotaxis protein MotA